MTTVKLVNDRITVVGHIDFHNANQIYLSGLVLVKAHQKFPIFVDLSQLAQGNTLALAICIQWLRHCPNTESLKLLAVPAKMQGIIRASNLEMLIQ